MSISSMKNHIKANEACNKLSKMVKSVKPIKILGQRPMAKNWFCCNTRMERGAKLWSKFVPKIPLVPKIQFQFHFLYGRFHQAVTTISKIPKSD